MDWPIDIIIQRYDLIMRGRTYDLIKKGRTLSDTIILQGKQLCAFVNVEVFKSSRRLLVHAESKINDIDRAINEFLDSDVTLSPEMYEHMYYVVADLKNPILDSIGFQIVETVGHCRAALDKLVADLAK
jgi:hypothetical protein